MAETVEEFLKVNFPRVDAVISTFIMPRSIWVRLLRRGDHRHGSREDLDGAVVPAT